MSNESPVRPPSPLSDRTRPKRLVDVPVGIERVVVLAATDGAFRDALARDREAATRTWNLRLRPSELALLRAVPEAVLQATIAHVDTTPMNLERRGFLAAVAATAVALTGAGAATGCSDDDKVVTDAANTHPDMGVRPNDFRFDRSPYPDRGPDTMPIPHDGPTKDMGIGPDMPIYKDGLVPDTLKVKEGGFVGDAGVRPRPGD